MSYKFVKIHGIKIFTLILLIVTSSQMAYSQFQHSGEINFLGLGSTDEKLPFWMYSNQRGRISKNTDFSGWISGKSIYKISESSYIEGGGGLLFQDEKDKLQIDELYLKFQNSWFKAFIGRKQKPELYNGLSSTNESIIWSLNARPIPGIGFSTIRPIFLLKEAGIGFEASLGEYILEKDRFVSNAHVHHKSFHLIYQPKDEFQIKIGIQHFVQWGGNSIPRGKQPDSFSDYLRIFMGQNGGEDASYGDQLNALGNNLGSYEVYINKIYKNFSLSLFYNSLFEDGTGLRWRNKIDGRYGLFIEKKDKNNLINSFIYEFYYTKQQSQNTSGEHIYDSYFNNGVYRSGWTYEKRVIGVPFFTIDYFDEKSMFNYPRIGNNRIIAHHFGIAGKVYKMPYKIMASYRKNYGHFLNKSNRQFEYYPPNDPRGKYILPSEIISSIFKLEILQNWINLNLIFAADFTGNGANLGAGIHLSKTL